MNNHENDFTQLEYIWKLIWLSPWRKENVLNWARFEWALKLGALIKQEFCNNFALIRQHCPNPVQRDFSWHFTNQKGLDILFKLAILWRITLAKINLYF